MNYIISSLKVFIGVVREDLEENFHESVNKNLRHKTILSDSIRKNRRVHFNNKIKVILVPTAQEYHDAGCGRDLWWSSKEMDNMLENFRKEIATTLKNDRTLNNDLTAAMTKLYQPKPSKTENGKAVYRAMPQHNKFRKNNQNILHIP